MGGGTTLFPDLGMHCQQEDCRQLDFLPFKCDSCRKVFCLEHRSYKSHECPKSDHKSRKVVVCDICSSSIETTGHGTDTEKAILERHEKSGDCDPKKKKKPRCPVRRCREVLTFSNTSTCKTCQIKVCLNHRFPGDHVCQLNNNSGVPREETSAGYKFLAALGLRSSQDCAKEGRKTGSSSKSPSASSSVKAC